jgi:RHS repeat-associated protein
VVLQDGTNTYVYGLDLISTTDGAGSQTYHLYDGLGSTVGLADGDGDPVDGYTYDVFGAIRTQSDSSPNYWLFTGEQRDSESALYYLRARYYDPAVGRFATQDPVSAPMARPQALNRYAYVGGNPVNYGDPTGLWCPWNPEDCVDPAADFFTVTIPEAGRNAVSFLGNSYYDLNVTFGCGGWVFTGGLQFSFEQGLYGYAGGGRGSCGGSATVSIGPNQEISEGVTCSVQGQYTVGGIGPVPIAVGGQAGFSGVVIGFKESRPTFSGSPFGEVGLGVGMTGWAVTCYEVEKIMGF